MSDTKTKPAATWIRGPQLRARWGGMPVATFYDHISKGKIPKAQYPFGPATPYWAMVDIEAFEQRAADKMAA